MARIEVVPVPQDHHGEGPVWLDNEQALAWVDVYEEPSIQRFFPATGRYESLAMPTVTSCLAPAKSGGLLAGMVGGFHLVDDKGKVINTGIVKHAGPALDNEALRLLRDMPAWQPAEEQGDVINWAVFTVAVDF